MLIPLAGLALALLACGLPSVFQSGSSTRPAPGASVNPGDLLPDPSVGLAGLQSYHAVYDLSLHGTLDGKAFDRQTHMEYTSIPATNGEQILWQEQQAGSLTDFWKTTRVGKALYTQSQDGQSCWGEYQDQPAQAVPLPASLLPAVVGATPAGTDTVNGAAAMHYTFTPPGLTTPAQGASGDVWIAQQGGYVVKYTLNIPAPYAPTGQGAETAETLTYQVDQVNVLSQIALPAACVLVLVDFPAMTDAQDIYRASGYMDYTSPSTLAQAADFYTQALPPLGWKQASNLQSSDQADTQMLEYTQGSQDLAVYLDRSSGSLEVTIVLSTLAATSQVPTENPGPTPTPGSQPTINPSQSGLPADVPLYPGATDLVAAQGVGVTFSSSDPPATIANYYRTQLKSLSWTLQTEVKPDANHFIQSWVKSNHTLVVDISVKNGTTTVMIAIHTQ